MPSLLLFTGGFITCAALIIFSGAKLSKHGDIIAELSGMGKAWFGLLILALYKIK